MKKGRHRRYEEARNLKRGGDLDIEAIFNDLGSDPLRVTAPESDDSDVEYVEDEDEDVPADRYADDGDYGRS